MDHLVGLVVTLDTLLTSALLEGLSDPYSACGEEESWDDETLMDTLMISTSVLLRTWWTRHF